MRNSISLRNVSLSLATAAFLMAGTGVALASPQPPSQSSQAAQSWQLKGVNARLDHALDAQSAHMGEKVGVKLDRTVQMANGTKLPGGTEVWGKVERVQASTNGGPSSLTLRFTTAQLKNGQKVPVKVTVISAFPASAGSSYLNAGDALAPAPRHINPQDKYTQEAGLLRNIEMKSTVQGRNSATFMDKNGNVKLSRGSYLQLAIGLRNNSGMHHSGI